MAEITKGNRKVIMNFVLGLGAIGGAFTVGNIFEHRANADKAKAQAEVEKAKIQSEIPIHGEANPHRQSSTASMLRMI